MSADDECAFSELFARYHAPILAYTQRRLPPSDAQDVVAETFTTVWKRLSDVPLEPATRPWLYTVARHAVANHTRGYRRFSRLVNRLQPIDVEGADEAVHRRAEHAVVHEELAKLRPIDREVLLLALWDELPHAEIALVIGCSDKNVAVRLHRAKQRLQAAVAPRLAVSAGSAPLTPNGATR